MSPSEEDFIKFASDSEPSDCETNDAESATDDQSFAFCKLAGELRNNIYEHLVSSNLSGEQALSFASTCRQIRKEFLPLTQLHFKLSLSKVDAALEEFITIFDFKSSTNALQYCSARFEVVVRLSTSGEMDLARLATYLSTFPAHPKIDLRFTSRPEYGGENPINELNKLVATIRQRGAWKDWDDLLVEATLERKIIGYWIISIIFKVGVIPWDKAGLARHCRIRDVLLQLGLWEHKEGGRYGSVFEEMKIEVSRQDGAILRGSAGRMYW